MSRKKGIEKARAIRSVQVKGKIQSAVNILRLYNEKITIRSVAKESNVSPTTVAKYLKDFVEPKKV